MAHLHTCHTELYECNRHSPSATNDWESRSSSRLADASVRVGLGPAERVRGCLFLADSVVSLTTTVEQMTRPCFCLWQSVTRTNFSQRMSSALVIGRELCSSEANLFVRVLKCNSTGRLLTKILRTPVKESRNYQH